MSRLFPFRAGLYDDPDSGDIEGVLDISGVLQPLAGDPLIPEVLAQPSAWQQAMNDGHVVLSEIPALYLVRAGWKDEDGRPWQRSGVVGLTTASSSVLTQPATVMVRDDAFSQLIQPEGVPLLRATDRDEKHFRVWSLQRAGYIETISDAFDSLAPDTSSPFVLATADFFTLPPGLLFCLPESFTSQSFGGKPEAESI